MTGTRILQLTDLHLFCDEDSTLKGIPTRTTLRDVVEFVRQNEEPFDRVVSTGDHTHDEQPESYAAVREILQPWIDRLSIIPGNHDDRSVMRTVFGDVVDRQAGHDLPQDDRITFSHRFGSWLCLGLDTHCPGEVPGRFGEAQARWLRDQLTEHGEGPSILFCHHPPVDVGSQWMDPIGLQDRELMLEVIESFPRVRLICCGHVHHEFDGAIGGTRVVTSPSTGVQFDPNGTEPRFASAPPGCRVIEFTADRLTTRVLRLPRADHTPVVD